MTTSKLDYWQLAYDSLDPTLKSNLNANTGNKRDILAAVLRAAETKKSQCLEKRWHFKKSNGDRVILRDVIEKIAKWVHKFKEIGDIVVQYDPVHAALPWACVRFLLQITVDDVDTFTSMAESLETIARLLTCYKAFEQSVLSHRPTLVGQMEDCLIRLYAEILTLLGQTVEYYQKTTMRRIVTISSQDKDAAQMERILAREAELLKIANIADVTTLLDIQSVLTRLSDRVKVFETNLEDEKHKELLHWVSQVNFRSIHEHTCDQRLPGTGKWILHHPVYKQWQTSSSPSILLLHGIPGCGKSVLSSVVIDSFLDARRASALSAPFAYFYCADYENERQRREPVEVLRSIVRQLTMSGPTIHSVILAEHQHRQIECKLEATDMTRLRTRDCEKLILDVTLNDPITIIIDGLDEVEENGRLELISVLSSIVTNSQNVAKIFVSSRDHYSVFAALPKAVKIRVQTQDNQKDVEQFARHQINLLKDEGKLLQTSPDIEDNILAALKQKTGEMFLWIEYQLVNFREKEFWTAKEMLNRLQQGELVTMDRVYANVLNRLLGNGDFASNIATKIISWLLYAKEPINARALIAAVSATDIGVEDVEKLCLNMVAFDARSSVFRLAHQSVQEFLRKQSMFCEIEANRILATACLETCTMGPPESNTPEEPLYQYGAIYWAHHYRLAVAGDFFDNLKQQMKEFIFDEDGELSLSFDCWLESTHQISTNLETHHPERPSLEALQAPQHTLLFVACVYNLPDLLGLLASSQIGTMDWNQKNALGQTGIYLAAAIGNDEIVSALIQHGAKINIQSGKHGNALAAACFAGHLSIVESLVRAGASVQSSISFPSAIEAACRGGREEVALYLLKTAYQPLTQENYDLALLSASQAGFLKVIETLQQPDLRASLGHTRIEKNIAQATRAIRGGQIAILKNLISRSNNPSAVLPFDGISIAALYGRTTLIDFLLKHGLSLEEEGVLGSPLRVACLTNHEQFAQKLLKKGAKIDVCGSQGTALQAAAIKGHQQMIQLLLDEGANVNLTGGTYGNALQAASYHGKAKVVDMLLRAGADIYRDGFTKDAFHAAAEGGHAGIIKMLLTRGYKFRTATVLRHFKFMLGPRTTSGSPGPRSTCQGSNQNQRERHKVRRLSSKQEDVSRNDFDTAVVRTISGMEPDPEILDHFDRENYALIAAASNNHVSVVHLLLQQRIVLHIPTTEIGLALGQAAMHGHTDVIKAFISSGVDLGHHRRKAFELAITGGHVGVFEALSDPAGEHQWENWKITAVLCSQSPSLIRRGLDVASERFTEPEFAKIFEYVLQQLSCRAELLSGQRLAFELIVQTGSSISTNAIIEAFSSACSSGNMSAIEILWSKARTACEQVQHLDRLLCLAAAKGLSQVVHFLITETRLNSLEPFPEEPLLFAATNGHIETAQILCNKIESSTVFDSILSRALVLSSQAGYPLVVEHLIHRGAEVNALASSLLPSCLDDDCWRCTHANILESGTTTEPVESDVDESSWLDEESFYSDDSQDREMPSKMPISALQACLRGLSKSGRSPVESCCLIEHQWKVEMTGEKDSVLEILLRSGVDPCALGGCQNYPIVYAAAHGSARSVRLLIEHAVDPNQSISGDSALIAAVGRRDSNADIVRQLLDAGASISTECSSTNQLMNTALARFASRHSGHHVEYYSRTDGQFVNPSSLEEVFEKGIGAIIEILLERTLHKPSEGIDYRLVLQTACFLDRYSTVRLLLDHGADVNATGYYYGTPLQAASRCGHNEIVELLLTAGADINIVGGRHSIALRAAVFGGHTRTVEVLIQNGAQTNLSIEDGEESESFNDEKDPTVLHVAVQARNLDILRLLLDAGLEVGENIGGPDHPLIKACENGDVAIVKALIDASAPINVAGSPRRFDSSETASPLHQACFRGHIDVVHLLLSRGAHVDHTVGPPGYGDSVVTIYLEEYVDAKDTPPWSPVVVAAQEGHVGVLRLLFEHSDTIPSKVVGEGIMRASCMGHLEVVELLRHSTIPEDLWSALSRAIDYHHIRLVDALLQHLAAFHGIKSDDRLRSALVRIQPEDHEILKLVSSFMAMDSSTLVCACIAGSISSVKAILDSGVGADREDEEGCRGLQAAAYNSQISIMHELIQRGADVNHVHPSYGSALANVLEGCLVHHLSCLEAVKVFIHNKSPISEKRDVADACNIDSGHNEVTQPLFKRHTDSPEAQPFMTRKRKFWKSSRMGVADQWHHGSTPNTKLSFKENFECEETVRFLVENGARDDYMGPFGSALHLAAFMGNESIVTWLLQNGSDVNATGGYFETALLAAIKGGHSDLAEFLLDLGVSACPTLRNTSALHEACFQGLAKTVYKLIQAGIDTNFVDQAGRTPLCAALQSRKDSKHDRFYRGGQGCSRGLNVVETLLKFGGNILVTETDLITASLDTSGTRLSRNTKALLRCDKEVMVPEKVILAVLDKHIPSEHLINLLLDRSANIGVTEAMLRHANVASTMAMLLKHDKVCEITSSIVEAQKDWQCIELLLAFDEKVMPTGGLILRALENPWSGPSPYLEKLLDRNPGLEITQSMLGAAAIREDMEILLAHCRPGMTISEEAIRGTFSHVGNVAGILELLLNYDPELRIPVDAVPPSLYSCEASEIMDLLFQHDPEMPMTEAMFLKAFEASYTEEQARELVEVMNRHGKTLVFTETIRDAVFDEDLSDDWKKLRESFCSLERK